MVLLLPFSPFLTTLKILSETPVESEEIMTIEEVIKRCEEVAEVQEEAAKEWHENQVRKCKLFPFAEMDYTHENECKKCADEHRQLAKWLEQLQKIQEIIKCWENGTLKEKDSVYAFHKICEVMENGTNDKRRNKTKK